VSLDLEISLVDRVIVGLPNSTFEALPAPRRLVETCVASVREAEQSGDAAKIIDWLDRNQLQPGADALLLGCLREVLHARSVDRDPLTDSVNTIHGEIAQVAREHCRLQTMHRQMGEHASATATILVAGLRTFDADLADDSETVGYLAQRFANFLKLGDDVCGRTGLCGLLHDIGKIAVPRSILRKTEPLESGEWDVLQTYPAAGAHALLRFRELSHIAALVGLHCERVDGSGYPSGTRKVPIESQIVGLLDAWHTMTVDRPHRPRMGPWEACDEIVRGSGTAFDTELVNAFRRLLCFDPDLTAERMRAA